MGQTREKKASKRALKAKISVNAISDIARQFESLHLLLPDDKASGKSIAIDSSVHLAPPVLSSKSSRSSLRSSAISVFSISKNEAQSYDPSLVEVRNTVDRGFALFATSRIPRGKLVLAEIPVLRLTSQDEENEAAVDQILSNKFDRLPKTFQKDFKKLHDAKKAGFSRLKSVYHSNCYNLEAPRSKDGGSCVGFIASRINHSCIPNVQFSFSEIIPEHIFDSQSGTSMRNGAEANSENGVMLFHALKTIPRGKEIVSNYETVYATASQRQLQLQMHYGFRCRCEACVALTDFWTKSDERRREMMNHRNELKRMEKVFTKHERLKSGGAHASKHCQKREETGEAERTEVRHGISLNETFFDEAVGNLEALDDLLAKEGLAGTIEQESVQREKEAWIERAKANREMTSHIVPEFEFGH